VLVVGGVLMLIVLLPVVLLGGAANPPCLSTTPITGSGGGTPGAGHFAAPLQLAAGRWYRVGATEYTGSGVGSDGSDLFAYPNTFAELSTLNSNPADLGVSDFTFSDADALGVLPYMTGLRVRVGRREMVLYKRDVGYGQGPGGQGPGSLIYRLDVFSTAAAKLGITKTPVHIQLAGTDGTGPTLGTTPAPPGGATSDCTPTGGGSGPSAPLNDTDQVQITADGSATAPASAPHAVALAVGAANQIDATPYPEPDVHYDDQDLSQLWPAYDCSATVSYVLYRAGLRGVTATNAAGLMSYGDPGPGKWITIYANTAHTWIVIGGRAFDTAHWGPTTPAGTGPRWLADPTGNLGDGLSYVVRHPPGL
jgi:hypothetical protein